MAGERRKTKQEMIEDRTNAYSAIYKLLQDGKTEMTFPSEIFHLAFSPWKIAARACNLKYHKGRLYSGNNQTQLPVIYMPKTVVYHIDDMGEVIPVAKEGFWVCVTPNDKGKMYTLEVVRKLKKDESAEDAYWAFSGTIKQLAKREKARCISKALFDKLLDTYTDVLSHRVKLGESAWRYSGWKIDQKTRKPENYWVDEDTIIDGSSKKLFRVLENTNHMDSKLSVVLFCATLFSISKPLLSFAKLPTDFLMYLEAKDKNDFDQNYYYRHYWTCYYCNPNRCEDVLKYRGFFCFERKVVGFLSPETHHNFPLLYRKGNPDSKHYESIGCFGRGEAERMKKAATLPILLAPIGGTKEENTKEPEKKRKRKPFVGCLTLDIPIHKNDRVFNKKRELYRKELFDFYSSFLMHLSDNVEECIAQAKHGYREALASLHCTTKSASERQRQIACLLTAVLLAENYVEQEAYQTYANSFSHMKFVLKQLIEESVASEVDFAQFLQVLLDKAGDQSPLLLQDDQYMYLHFKEYWGYFETYCKQNNIVIQESEKEFRRKYLVSDFLKPQYAAKPGAYPRYDCRKLIGSEKKTVMVVKKEILQYARKPAKSQN